LFVCSCNFWLFSRRATTSAADVNDETTIAGVQAALAGENSLLPEFKTLGAAAQVEKAEAVQRLFLMTIT